MRIVGLVVLVLSAVAIEAAGPSPIELVGGKCRVTLDAADGSIVSISEVGKPGTILRSGEHGLWHARFADGSEVDASAWKSGGERRMEAQRASDGKSVRLRFSGPEGVVEVTLTATAESVDLVGTIQPKEKVVLDFALPARLRFDPANVVRFVEPVNGHTGVGVAFNGEFFGRQSRISSWDSQKGNPAGYVAIFGKGPKMLPFNNPLVPLTVNGEGRKWLEESLAKCLGGAMVRVNRPTEPAHVKFSLLDSPNGSYLSASDLGGSGLMWRIGGSVAQEQAVVVREAVGAVVRKLAAAPQRKKIGLVSLQNGPLQGALAHVSVQEWLERFKAEARRVKGAVEVVELDTPQAMLEAAAGKEFLLILNPYGEWLPVPEGPESLVPTAKSIAQYVRNGGHWFEVGGYSFMSALQRGQYLKYEGHYPPVFADFQHLESTGGSAAVYRVQPRNWKPWAGEKDSSAILVPGRIGCGGDDRGGYAQRAFSTYVQPGKSWTCPVVRLTAGVSAQQELRNYAAANAITRPLSQKLPAPMLETFRKSMLLKLDGPVEKKLAVMPLLPVPTLIHYSDYLKGGFDKEYPDHLPPNAAFGTPEQYRTFLAAAKKMGHLTMPYTNPTWWCDHPRGPTFEKAGDAPLARGLDGKPYHEAYGKNDGWTTTFWHPAVRAANDAVLRQFTAEYPCDILFQDQCGARTWRYDTNPASPTPYAYAEGILSLVDEQCMTKPLSTEDAYDRVINSQVQVCGLTFAVVPGRRPAWARPLKNQYHPAVWTVFPVDQIIAHDKVAFCHHDLGLFVTDRPMLTWTLGLGFCMSYRVNADALKEPRHLEWVRWIDRIQKSVCARYVGGGVVDFQHDRGSKPDVTDEGMFRATYGPVRMVANLGPNLKNEAGRELAGWGFHASAPGMVAANLASLGGLHFGDEGISFVVDGEDLWVFSEGDREVAVELPVPVRSRLALTLDGVGPVPTILAGSTIRFRLPATPDKPGKVLWHGQVKLTR